MTAMGKMLFSFIKFSQPSLYENKWRTVWRSSMWILGLKGSHEDHHTFLVNCPLTPPLGQRQSFVLCSQMVTE